MLQHFVEYRKYPLIVELNPLVNFHSLHFCHHQANSTQARLVAGFECRFHRGFYGGLQIFLGHIPVCL